MQKEPEWGDQIALAMSGEFEDANAIFMHLCKNNVMSPSQHEHFNGQITHLNELCFQARK